MKQAVKHTEDVRRPNTAHTRATAEKGRLLLTFYFRLKRNANGLGKNRGELRRGQVPEIKTTDMVEFDVIP